MTDPSGTESLSIPTKLPSSSSDGDCNGDGDGCCDDKACGGPFGFAFVEPPLLFFASSAALLTMTSPPPGLVLGPANHSKQATNKQYKYTTQTTNTLEKKHS